MSGRKELVKLIRGISNRHDLYRVFSDFLELSALALANRFDLTRYAQREVRYMQVIKGYRKDEAVGFAHALGALCLAMEEQPGDVLGDVFGELELGNSARGQFFTPYHLCEFMARLTVDADHARALIAERGFFTVQEPAVGAGAMIIALAMHLAQAGIDYTQHLHVTAVDVDQRAVHMAFIQFTLLGIPAKVVDGNTLSLEVREVWPTFAHVVGLWESKLRRGYALGSAMDRNRLPFSPTSVAPAQLSLFTSSAAMEQVA